MNWFSDCTGLANPNSEKTGRLDSQAVLFKSKGIHSEVWKPCWLFEPKVLCCRVPCCLRNSSAFVLFRPSTDYIRPTHIMRGILLYSEFSDLNVNLIQKYYHWNIQNNVWSNIWHHGPANLTHKINHHTLCHTWRSSGLEKLYKSAVHHLQF